MASQPTGERLSGTLGSVGVSIGTRVEIEVKVEAEVEVEERSSVGDTVNVATGTGVCADQVELTIHRLGSHG